MLCCSHSSPVRLYPVAHRGNWLDKTPFIIVFPPQPAFTGITSQLCYLYTTLSVSSWRNSIGNTRPELLAAIWQYPLLLQTPLWTSSFLRLTVTFVYDLEDLEWSGAYFVRVLGFSNTIVSAIITKVEKEFIKRASPTESARRPGAKLTQR